MLSFFFPKICTICEEEGDLEICASCFPKLKPVREMHESSFVIKSCFEYNEFSGKIIKDAKYHNKTQNTKLIAKLMIERHIDVFDGNPLIIPVNTSFFTQINRKYNVPSLICLYLKKMLKKHKKAAKFMPFLVRKRGLVARSQVALTREARLSNLLGTFYLANSRSSKNSICSRGDKNSKNLLQNQNVILVDDVLTTGATSKVCAFEILKQRPKQLTVLTFARVL